MKRMKRLMVLMLVSVMLLTACGGSGKASNTAAYTDPAFEPRLDTEKQVELDAAVFFGNFEAFDQVINDFNEYYPNVSIAYSQTNNTSTEEFFQNNPTVDIFMTSPERGYILETCEDLLAGGVDVSAVSEGLLESSTYDGKLLCLPMGLLLRGIVVNKTLLKKEGLTVPQTWQEFLDTLEALKEKGYTPLQGPDRYLSNLFRDMGMVMIQNDTNLFKAVTTGDTAGAARLKTVYDRMMVLKEKGYISEEVNAEYPSDNYDGAILKFFEGNVPFWVCDTEKVSGMKKRESKSEAYSSAPFEYEFMFPPIGDNGVYAYTEPWYGFAVYKESDKKDYAMEFLRFMARKSELDTLASVKGVPSIAKDTSDSRYVNLSKLEKVEEKATQNGTVQGIVASKLLKAGNGILSGELLNSDAAVKSVVEECTRYYKENNLS